MPGKGLVMEGAVQQAPQLGRHSGGDAVGVIGAVFYRALRAGLPLHLVYNKNHLDFMLPVQVSQFC